jgi:hypothetical protein
VPSSVEAENFTEGKLPSTYTTKILLPYSRSVSSLNNPQNSEMKICEI